MKTISAALLGAPLDPFNSQTRQHIALVAFLAWIGLGADGLSSSCYGPEEAFLALGEHTHLALYMAAATALTVFVIAVGYNQKQRGTQDCCDLRHASLMLSKRRMGKAARSFD